jgi:photosystem II stability/assembly factor-like uncharacterized protein
MSPLISFSRSLVCVLCCCAVSAYAQVITSLTTNPPASIRGLSVSADGAIWASGSKGWTARSADGGSTWSWNQLKNYQDLDFRDIHAFSSSSAITVSAGSPAVILLTEDGGLNWKEVYRDSRPEIFLDGLSFYNHRRGLIYGDPIAGQLQLLETTDGGTSWKNISARNPGRLAEGEAAFAASGTGIFTKPGGDTWIATGGRKSRIFYSPDFGNNWRAIECPIIQGEASTGIFSLNFYSRSRGAVAGGDYAKDTLRRNNMLYTRNGGRSWHLPEVAPHGYRSVILHLDKRRLVASGTSGTDMSADGGKTWKPVTSEGFHTAAAARDGRSVYLAGSGGRIARLDLR